MSANSRELRADRRRVDRNKRTTYDPIRLNQRHQEILNLALLGLSDKEISTSLGVSYNVVHYTKNSTLGQQKLAIMRGARDAGNMTVAQRMQEIIPKALEVYEKILTEECEPGKTPHGGASIMLQKQTADKVLENYSGLVVPKKVMVGHAQITPEFLRELKESGRNAARECGMIVVEAASGE